VPPSGVLYYKYKHPEAKEETSNTIANKKIIETEDKTKVKIRFSDMPMSKASINGLFKAKFVKLTDVQRASIPHAIAGRDVVVCARTGSGKTLCYLIPIIERLFQEKWSRMDGLGAILIVPTRELAIQAFEVLRSFGGMHDMSAGLLIGGKNLKFEQERIRNMNILICTPGRLLQHMNESEGFDSGNLKILVFDEVDRILDMGFKDAIDQIMKNLPK
jgi:ATP-dependent RNA helicase DDX10/DBP4